MSEPKEQVERILERVKHELLAVLLAVEPSPVVVDTAQGVDPKTQEQIALYALIAQKPYLTKKELALYLGVSERSLGEWMARPTDQNPLPESAAGSDPRFKRETVDEWARREGQRRRLRLAS